MDNNSIEDIMIDKDFNKKSKKGKPAVVIVLVLILLLTLAVAGYSYYINKNKETDKQLFFKSISNVDLNFFANNQTYTEIGKKIFSNSFEMHNDFTMSTTMKQEGTEETQDFSKYLLNLTTIKNVETEENYNELNLSYSDNNLINLKIIDNKDQIALFSDEVVNKYVGIDKNNVNTFLEKIGVEKEIIDQYEKINKKLQSEEIDLDTETIISKYEEYSTFLFSKLGEEKFASQENQISLVKENQEEVNVTAYKLRLTPEEYVIIAKEFLMKLKNDEEFIQKFVTNSSENETANNSEENAIEIITIPGLNDEKNEETLEIKDILTSILMGKKIDSTVDEVRAIIDEAINNINDGGNGLEITAYVSEFATEKISVVLPDASTIDVELNSQSETEKSAVITYLETQTNGIKLEIDKLQNDASTTTQAICNIIENKKITQKISFDVTTKGTTASKNFNTEGTITYSNNDGEIKVNIKNKIDFDKVSEIEDLTDENTLFLDALSDEEFALTILEIGNKIQEVYTNKQQSLNFIDTNAQAPDITQNTNRDELRNLVVSTISAQMGRALVNGENFTLESIQNLQIAGYTINVTIENGIAIVSVNGVKFKIDSNFNLSDAE